MGNIAGAAFSFFGTEHAISDQIEAYKHDARVAQFNADTTRLQGQASDEAMARDIQATQGKMVTAYAGSGVTSDGSPNAALADSIRRGVLDRASNSYNYENTALNYEKQKASLKLLAHNVQRTQFATALAAGLQSYTGGNGGMGNVGSTGQTNDSFTMGGGGSSNYLGNNSGNYLGGNYGSQSFGNGNGGMFSTGEMTGGDYGTLGSGNSTGYFGGNSLSGGSAGWGS